MIRRFKFMAMMNILQVPLESHFKLPWNTLDPPVYPNGSSNELYPRDSPIPLHHLPHLIPDTILPVIYSLGPYCTCSVDHRGAARAISVNSLFVTMYIGNYIHRIIFEMGKRERDKLSNSRTSDIAITSGWA